MTYGDIHKGYQEILAGIDPSCSKSFTEKVTFEYGHMCYMVHISTMLDGEDDVSFYL